MIQVLHLFLKNRIKTKLLFHLAQPNLMTSFNQNTPNSMRINNFAETGIQVARQIINNKYF